MNKVSIIQNNEIIKLEEINKWYSEFHVLRDISFDVLRGERIVICGPSGSGKSTLIRCINQLEKHDTGNVEINGVTLSDAKSVLKNVRSEMGMVFQQFNLYPHLSVLENCTLGQVWVKKRSKSEANSIALHFLERVKIVEQADKYPSQLSGGQQQRVAIARALCMNPKILLFDEPTSALDPEMIKEVLDVMIDLAQEEITMLCVTHEMGFARSVADRVVFMDAGEIVEQGDPISFFDNPQSARTQRFLGQVMVS